MPSLGVTGKLIREVVGKNHAAVVDDHPSVSNWTTSKVSRSFRFERTTDSVADYASTSRNLGISGTGSWSVHMRVKVDSSATNVYGWLFWVGSSTSTNNRALGIRTFTDGKYGVAHWFNDLSFAPINYDNWEQIAVTFDGSTERFYLNGAEVLNRTTSLNILDGRVWFNARGAPNTQATEYDMASTFVYDRVLSSTEIKQLYVDSLAPFRTLKRTVVRVPAAIPAATVVGSIKKPKTIIKPSYQSGYARNASESENPKLWDGLVGAWMPSLGVTGETLLDVSGNGNHGTLQYDTSWKTNSSETSLYFDGAQDHVSGFGDVSLSSTEPFTIATKVRLNSFLDQYPNILQLKTDTAYAFNMAVSLSGSYKGILFGSANSWATLRTDTTFETNRTQSIALVYNGGGASLASSFSMYLDGKSIVLVSAGGFATTTQNNYLGTTNAGSRGIDDWHGNINAFSIYNRVLSPSEIKQLYVDSLAPFRKKQRVSVAVPAAVAPSATSHPLRSLAHPLEQ